MNALSSSLELAVVRYRRVPVSLFHFLAEVTLPCPEKAKGEDGERGIGTRRSLPPIYMTLPFPNFHACGIVTSVLVSRFQAPNPTWPLHLHPRIPTRLHPRTLLVREQGYGTP